MERELDDELQFHLEREAEKYERAGVPHEEAMRRARLSFGGIERIKDDTRDARGTMIIDSLRQDLRFAWRNIMARPGFTAAIVLTLGLGIGANAAMFGVVDRLMFRPFPYLRDPGTVHRVYLTWQDRERSRTSSAFEYTRYLDLTKFTTSFSQFAGFATRGMAVGVGDASRERSVAVVNASFFDFFDMRPALGRFFVAAEDVTPKGASVVVQIGRAHV